MGAKFYSDGFIAGVVRYCKGGVSSESVEMVVGWGSSLSLL